MAKRSYSGTAKTTSLSGAITAATATINVVDATGYPTGADGPFVITIDAGLTTEEKVLISAKVGNSFTVASSGRGWDSTTASDHDNAAPVAHTFSATDAREANDHVNDSAGDPHPQYLTPAEGAVLYSSAEHSHPAPPAVTKTIRISRDITWRGLVANPNSTDYNILPVFISAPPSQTVTLVKARHRVRAGSATSVYLLRNGTAIPGWGAGPTAASGSDPISVTTTPTTFDGPDVVLADGDMLELRTAFVGAGVYDLVFELQLDVTV